MGAETHAHSMCYKFTFYLLTYLLTYITTLDMFCPAFVSEYQFCGVSGLSLYWVPFQLEISYRLFATVTDLSQTSPASHGKSATNQRRRKQVRGKFLRKSCRQVASCRSVEFGLNYMLLTQSLNWSAVRCSTCCNTASECSSFTELDGQRNSPWPLFDSFAN